MAGSILSILYDEVQRIWRYRWLVVVIAAMLFGGAASYIMRMPDIYQASAQIYINKETPIAAAAHDVSLVGDNFGSPYVVQKTLLNDQYLRNILLQINPAARTMTPEVLEGATARLRSKIKTDFGDDGFLQIYYQDTNPVRARDVVQLLLNQFISANMSRNNADIAKASSFLDQQIAVYAAKTRASDEQMADFRRKHPDVANAGAPMAVSDAAMEVANARAAYDAALSGQGSNGASAGDSQVTAARARLAALRLEYTDQYPDVIAAKRQLDALMAAAASRPAAAVGPSATVTSARDRLGAAQARLRQAEQGPAASPLNAEWADLKKNNDMLRNNYQEMQSRREAARMSQAVYADKNSGKYQVTSPPTIPPLPSGPNRNLFLLIAAAASLGGGIAAAYLLGAINGIFVAPRELEEAFGLPVAGTVSLEKTWQTDRKTRGNHRISALLAIGLMMAGATGTLLSTRASAGAAQPAIRISISPLYQTHPGQVPFVQVHASAPLREHLK